MHTHAGFNRLFALVTLACMSSLAHAGPLTLNVQMPSPYNGAEFSYVVRVSKNDFGMGTSYSGLFMLRSTLPEGMSFLSGGIGGWTCTIEGAGSRDLTCTETTTVTDTNPNLSVLSITAKTHIAMPLAPAEITTTISSAQVPLPLPLICAPSPSMSSCWTVNPMVQESKIEFIGWGGVGPPI